MRFCNLLFISALCVMPMQAMVLNLNNDGLEKVVERAWDDYTQCLSNYFDAKIKGKEPLGFKPEELKKLGRDAAVLAERKRIVDQCMGQVFAKLNLAPALSGQAAQTPTLRAMLMRLLSTIAFEFFIYSSSEIAEVLEPFNLGRVADDVLDSGHYTSEQKKTTIANLERVIAELNKLQKGELNEKTCKAADETLKAMTTEDPSWPKAYEGDAISFIANGIFSYLAVPEICEVTWARELLARDQEYLRYAIDKYNGSKEAARILKRTVDVRNMLLTRPEELSWCGCQSAPLAKRVVLIINLVNDVRRTYKPGQPVVYVSLAAGMLLQDYLTVEELKRAGYINLDINLVEGDFRTHAQLKRDIKAAAQEDKYHEQNSLNNLLNQAATRAAFIRKIGATVVLIPNKAGAAVHGIHVTTWSNADHYVEFAERYPQFKANIVVLTDPGGGTLYLDQDQRINANSFIVYDAQGAKWSPEQGYITIMKNPGVYGIYFPRGGFELYTNRPASYDLSWALGPTRTFEDVLARQDAGETVQWIADIYVSLKNIVLSATTPNALIYMLDDPAGKIEGEREDEDSEGILQVFTVDQYKKLPAIAGDTYDELQEHGFHYVPRVMTQAEEKERKGKGEAVGGMPPTRPFIGPKPRPTMPQKPVQTPQPTVGPKPPAGAVALPGMVKPRPTPAPAQKPVSQPIGMTTKIEAETIAALLVNEYKDTLPSLSIMKRVQLKDAMNVWADALEANNVQGLASATTMISKLSSKLSALVVQQLTPVRALTDAKIRGAEQLRIARRVREGIQRL